MNGLEAIAAHNGWAISVVGVSIVFTGLTLLSLTISQLHKVIKFWDERDKFSQQVKQLWKKEEPREEKEEEEEEETIPDFCLAQDIDEITRQFKLLTKRIGEPFPLPKLLEISERCGLFRPHSAINYLLRTERILPDGKGYFYWNENK
ncbi:OadG family protein [Desulfonema magnum]|uniref:Oxaloacetate decarboxylase domain-containing protein, gamma chain n=1 Tax=Desulfonema magnum TaxID=45655 RepID=A0A975GTQ3_9BACT|nr:OadG family protein [Desulfonema magnum]QTA93311.1 Oxaloacetate decarboxylase domain-containing protein, gamma chain [Desulfonema magnum]